MIVGIAAPMMRASRAPKKTASKAAVSTRTLDFFVSAMVTVRSQILKSLSKKDRKI
jgi:hypothetical protein